MDPLNPLPLLKLYKISPAGSISIQGPLSPLWTNNLKENSKNLWCPIEKDSLVLHSHCLNICSTSYQSDSWFSKKDLSISESYLISDIISLVHSFYAKMHGRRSHSRKVSRTEGVSEHAQEQIGTSI